MPGVGQVEFSPNAKYAVQVNMLVPAIDNHLFLLNLENGNFKSSVLPSPIDLTTLGDYRHSEVKWAFNSRKFYFGVVAFPERAELSSSKRQSQIDKIYQISGYSSFSRYFRYEIALNKFTRINGKFVTSPVMLPRQGLHYYENGRKVKVYMQRR